MRTFTATLVLMAMLNLFAIEQACAQFRFLGAIYNSDEGITGLTTPSHAVVSPDDRYVYVAGNGDHMIAIFQRDQNTGELTFVEAVVNGENGVEGLTGVRQLAISEDGQYLYAVAAGDHAISLFTRNIEEGTLSFEETIRDGENGADGLEGAYSLTISPDGKNIYVVSITDNAVSSFSVNETNGTLTPRQVIFDNGTVGTTGGLKLRVASSVVVSPDNQHVYVTGFEDDGVSVFERNLDDQGRLTNIQNIDNWADFIGFGNVRPTDIVISDDNQSVYVSGYGGTSAGNLTFFSRNVNTGLLSKQQAFADDASADDINFTLMIPLGRLTSLALTPNNNLVFTTSDESTGDTAPDFRVNSFKRNTSTGALTPYRGFGESATVEGVAEPNDIAFSQDGKYFYMVSGVENAISSFEIQLPSITGISPHSGYMGTQVSISGEYFGSEQNSSILQFGEETISASNIVSWSANEIVVTLPEMGVGEVEVSITASEYTATAEDKFTVNETPAVMTINSVSPTQGKSGSEVNIEGVKFGDGTTTPKVFFGTSNATEVIWISETSLTATVPDREEGSVEIMLVLANDTARSDMDFTIDNTSPIGSIQLSDADGEVQKGQVLTINATFEEAIADSPLMQIGLQFPEADSLFAMTKVSDTEYRYEYVVGEGDVQVALFFGRGEDLAGNTVTANPQNNITFTIDNTSPLTEFSPVDEAIEVSTTADIVISFNEAIRQSDNSPITSEALEQIIEFEKIGYDDENQEIDFTASYEAENFRITLQPEALESNETYLVKIEEGTLEDAADNPVNEARIRFKTGTGKELVVDTFDFFLHEENVEKVLLEVSDVNFIKKGEIYVRGITDYGEWTGPIDLMSLESLFTENILHYPFSAMSDPVGIEYYFHFVDKFDHTVADTIYLYHEHEEGMGFSVTAGSGQDDYQIISFPLKLNEEAVARVFDELGNYDKEKWRLFTMGEDNTFIEFGDFQAILPGKAYLLIFTDNQLSRVTSGKGHVVKVEKDKPFEIDVHEGWNLIGNPYPFDVSWAEVVEHPANAEALLADHILSYGPNWDTKITTLSQGSGGLVYVGADISSISIPLNAQMKESNNMRKQNAWEAKASWQVGLKLSQTQGSIKRTISGFGMHPEAVFSRDPYDIMTPPGFGTFLDINFSYPEYVYANFSKDIVPVQEEYIWEFEVATNLGDEPLSLAWSNETLPENENQLLLFDTDMNQVVDMRSKQSYTFQGQKSRSFKILYGRKNFIEEHLQATTTSLNPAYPNPFQTATHIPFAIPKSAYQYHVEMKIYDMAGRVMCILLDKEMSPGFYEVIWEGKHTSGQKVKSGTYICELIVNDGTQGIKKTSRILLSAP